MSDSPVAPIKVDVWSDVQCPWCYIGKRRFESAVDASGIPVEIEYRSFELAPDTPVEYDGTPVQYLAERKGVSPDQARQMVDHVTQLAAAEGLAYDYDHIHQTNTVRAHELLHYAKERGRQSEMKEALLQAYFVDGGHVGRIAELADLAATVGLDRDDVVRALESRRYADAVAADVAQAAAYGINGVPFYVFEGRYGVSGAQAGEVFADVLAKVAAERVEA
ncbi:protein disulfide isomerase FrnE [Microbacterium awajiense]|uniref:Protein disulfide isomerase FrnE n=1 Tax=Microbacterium awajiense TaxID=415214 RepID=A0ABP7A3W4_9MICO